MKPKETAEHYILSSSPHAHADVSVSQIMLDVIIALLPTTIVGVLFVVIVVVVYVVQPDYSSDYANVDLWEGSSSFWSAING